MDELITLNQLKEYDAEKTNKLNVRFDNVYNYVDNRFNNVANDFNNCYNYIDNGLNTVNSYVVNEISNVYNYVNVSLNNTDTNVSNLYNYVNNVQNELNETHNNFNTVNLSATNAQIMDLNVANVVSNSLDVNTVSINGVVGNNGHVLGVVNGKSEWMDIPDPIDADNFYVNNIYVNNIAKVNGFDVTSYSIVAEDDYNNLTLNEKRSPVFYLTLPNGNLYFQRYRYSPSMLPPLIANVYVNLFGMNRSITTHSLELGVETVTNNLINGSSIYAVQDEDGWNNAVSVGVDAGSDTIYTNAIGLYIHDASGMYNGCYNLTDSFICNPNLITNAPVDYDPMKYCVSMYDMFNGCTSFNQPITIPETVTSVGRMFYNSVFNSSVEITNGVTNLAYMFYNAYSFNYPITIPDTVNNLNHTFDSSGFNQPITIPGSVADMNYAFANSLTQGARAGYFNQPITISNGVGSMAHVFERRTTFNQPLTIPQSVWSLDNALNGCEVFNSTVTILGSPSVENLFRNCRNYNKAFTVPPDAIFASGLFFNCTNFSQSVRFPVGTYYLSEAFYGCTNFDDVVYIERPNDLRVEGMFTGCTAFANSWTRIHLNHLVPLNTSNATYNRFVNGSTGIAFAPNRITNDL